jgi:putative ABC transport system permease protein
MNQQMPDGLTFRWLEHGLQDSRHAFRAFLRAPGFSFVAILTLALGIGANTAIFSVVYGILVRPLPYRDAARLVLVQREQDLGGAHRPVPVPFFSPAEAAAWTERSQSFESTALYAAEVAVRSDEHGTELIDSAVVSGSFFPLLGGPMRAGRPLGVADDLVASVVVSERLWQRLFGRSPSALGQPLILSSQAYTIVGVASSEFQFPSPQTDVWIPAAIARTHNPRCCGFRMIARITGAQSVSGAAVEVDGLARSFAAEAGGSGGNVRATVVSLPQHIAGPIRPALLVLFTGVGLALLVACGNVTNLLLARHGSRERETATRWALGASPGRLVAQTVIDGSILAAAGTMAGVVLATALVSALQHFEPAVVPRLDGVRVDLPVLLFSAALMAVVAVGINILPALQSAKAAGAPRSGATPGSPRARQVRRILCVTEVAVSLVLLVGAVLLGRSLVRLMHSDLGVRTDHVVTASMNLGFGGRPTDARALARVERVIEQVRGLPGIEAVGVGTALPPQSSRLRLTLRRAGDTVDYQAAGVAATPDYFRALGMRLVKGRLFTPSDDLTHPPVMIMSVDTARRFFGDGDPIGRTLTLPFARNGTSGSEEMTLVGTIANVKYSGLDAAPDDAVYRPFRQQVWVAPFLVARTTTDPARLVEAIRRTVSAADRATVVSDVKPLDGIIAEAAAQPRIRTLVLSSIAALALALSAVGLYGVVAYSVSQRSREIGIRMALGADEAEVLRMVLREGALLAATGIACGLTVSYVVTRALTGLLYGTEPTDPASFALAAAGLMAVMLVASYIPARHATRVDPNMALRAD